MADGEKVLGICANCDQTKEVTYLAKTNILVCEDCRGEFMLSYLSGKKIYIQTEEYNLPDAVNKEFLISELEGMHKKIHDSWFFQKTGQYELYHYLVIRELFALGEDPSELCYGELKDLYNKRRMLMSQYYK